MFATSSDPAMETRVNRESLLKRKTACPHCGRQVSLKFLATRHECAKKRMGRPVGTRCREKNDAEMEAWAAKLEKRAVEAFLKRNANAHDMKENDNDNDSDNPVQ